MRFSFEPDFFQRPEISAFLSNGLLLDTGPLYLFLVGKHAPEKLSSFGYSKADFNYLVRFLTGAQFNKLIITPHVFHEFYKHTQKIFDKKQPELFEKMKEDFMHINEEHVRKSDIMHSSYFKFFEIGELSLYLAYRDLPTAILIDESNGVFAGKLKENQNKLVLNFKTEIIPFMLNLP